MENEKNYPNRTYRVRDYPEDYGGTPEASMEIEVVVEIACEYYCTSNCNRIAEDVMNTMMQVIRSYGKYTECVVRFVDMDTGNNVGGTHHRDTF